MNKIVLDTALKPYCRWERHQLVNGDSVMLLFYNIISLHFIKKKGFAICVKSLF